MVYLTANVIMVNLWNLVAAGKTDLLCYFGNQVGFLNPKNNSSTLCKTYWYLSVLWLRF